MNEQIKHIIIDALILLVISTMFVTIVNWGLADLKKGKPQNELTVAILQQDIEEIQKILSKDGTKSSTYQDDHGRTSLMWACYAYIDDSKLFSESEQKRLEIVQKLLPYVENNIDLKDNDGWTALSWASWSGLNQIIPLLIQKGADINAKDNNGYTPLMLAALRGNDSVVETLLQSGSNLSETNKDGQTAHTLAQKKQKEYQKDTFKKTIAILEKTSVTP